MDERRKHDFATLGLLRWSRRSFVRSWARGVAARWYCLCHGREYLRTRPYGDLRLAYGNVDGRSGFSRCIWRRRRTCGFGAEWQRSCVYQSEPLLSSCEIGRASCRERVYLPEVAV